MKIQLLCITLLMSSGSFAAQAPEKPAEKGIFASVLAQIKCGKKKKEEKKKSVFHVDSFDKDGNPSDIQPAICGGFFGPGDGWGMADGLQMKEDGSIVPKQADQK